ncbi:MAG: hypothetical protein ACK5LJ_16135 [Paracoccus sp. (in: a-proteobacteria)]
MTDARHAKGNPGPAIAGRRLAAAAPAAVTALVLSSCGGTTDEMLRGGVPASTNLPRATSLPADAVRTVSRHDYGWRLIYHVESAPANADSRAANALCGLESRHVARVEQTAQIAPEDDPGTRKIDIYCA